MNWKNWIPLALSVVLGLVAAKVARDSLTRSRATGQSQPRAVKVVVAKGTVAPGQELTGDLLTLGAIAGDKPPPNAFTDASAVLGRVTLTPLFAGQPIVEQLLAPKGVGTGIQALVPRGMRAITVEVNETSGLAGMLLPGCRVDVMSTLNGATREESVATTIVQDVLVQAVGQRLMPSPAGANERDAQAFRSVTLMVTPHEAEAIELASSLGRTRLVLRGPQDRAVFDSPGVTFVELRGDDTERVTTPVVAVTNPLVTLPLPPATQPTTRPAIAKQPQALDPFEDQRPRRTVTLIRGSTKTEVIFDLPRAPESESAITRTSNEPVER